MLKREHNKMFLHLLPYFLFSCFGSKYNFGILSLLGLMIVDDASFIILKSRRSFSLVWKVYMETVDFFYEILYIKTGQREHFKEIDFNKFNVKPNLTISLKYSVRCAWFFLPSETHLFF